MKNVSIRDIARQGNVSPATVSLVLNGKAKQARISDGLAESIKKLAAELGYHPNQTAISLRTGKSKTIGLIIEDISDMFFASLAKVVEEEAVSIGYKVVYCSTDNDDEKGNELIKMLFHKQVDGFLITPTNGMEKEIYRLTEQKKPIVLMDRYFPTASVPYVLVDNYMGVTQGIEHLISKGYSRIGFITVDLKLVHMEDRLVAYMQTMEKHGLDKYTSVLKIKFEEDSAKVVTDIVSFIKNNTELDAVFIATHYLGVYCLESLRKLNLKIPQDMAIVCFDDHDIFRLYVPGITVIRQPVKDIAQAAMKMLVQLFEGKKMSDEESYVFKKPMLVVREST